VESKDFTGEYIVFDSTYLLDSCMAATRPPTRLSIMDIPRLLPVILNDTSVAVVLLMFKVERKLPASPSLYYKCRRQTTDDRRQSEEHTRMRPVQKENGSKAFINDASTQGNNKHRQIH